MRFSTYNWVDIMYLKERRIMIKKMLLVSMFPNVAKLLKEIEQT